MDHNVSPYRRQKIRASDWDSCGTDVYLKKRFTDKDKNRPLGTTKTIIIAKY